MRNGTINCALIEIYKWCYVVKRVQVMGGEEGITSRHRGSEAAEEKDPGEQTTKEEHEEQV